MLKAAPLAVQSLRSNRCACKNYGFDQSRYATAKCAQSEEARRGTRGDAIAPLAEYNGTSFEDVQWKPIGMGVKQSILERQAATARLLFIPPGTAVRIIVTAALN